MRRILLLLEHSENRRLLAEWLATHFEVLASAGLADLAAPFDLCIIDGPTLSRSWQQVQQRKQDDYPCFVPVLLVTSRQDVNLITRQLWKTIDELILMPIEKQELFARVEILLRSRQLCVDLEASSEQLQNEIEAKTRLVEELERARQKAEEAVRVRDEFLSIASHELKTPITSLRGFAQLGLRQLSKNGSINPQQLQNWFSTIDQQSAKLTYFMRQLLDVSRLESGRLTLDLEETDLVRLTQEVISLMHYNASSHPIHFQAPPELWIRVDPLRLEQVIVNLLDNAIKYSHADGAIEVEISAPDPNTARLTVQDHGVGIPTERRARIFERFYQAHGDGYLGGLGLGLYVTQQIIELHQGQIAAEFPTEGGTRFVIQLPIPKSVPA